MPQAVLSGIKDPNKIRKAVAGPYRNKTEAQPGTLLPHDINTSTNGSTKENDHAAIQHHN